MSIKQRIEFLVENINLWNHEYYNLSKPSISDSEYDGFFRELKELEEKYPQYKMSNSPTSVVGAPVSSGAIKVRHDIPMLSLGNSMNTEEFKAFDKRVRRDLGYKEGEYVTYICELKIDGLAVSLRYKDGKVILGATRGDGIEGEDITANLKTLADVPKEISFKGEVEVRGEVYLSKEGFKDWALEAWNKTKNKNKILWLVNVEKMARKLFQYARKNLRGIKVIFISGKLPPIIRTWKIEKLKELMNSNENERVLVISTQVLEAGIDLDFDGVVRDLAPLPVLIQVAGRLNRRWERSLETLYVMQLKEDTVYSDFEFRHTGAILAERENELLEKDYYEACKEYYKLCEEMPPSETPSEWMDQFVHLRRCSFQMIEEPDYQASAVCANIGDYVAYLDMIGEKEEFLKEIKKYVGIDYVNVYELLDEVISLESAIEYEHSLERKEVMLTELRKKRDYLSWYETTCNISDIEKVEINSKEIYITELPLEYIGF